MFADPRHKDGAAARKSDADNDAAQQQPARNQYGERLLDRAVKADVADLLLLALIQDAN